MRILGIDVGGSGIKGAPVDTRTGRLLAARRRVATPQPATPRAVARAVARIVERFKWKGPVGCALPAVVKHGRVRTAANISRRWLGVDARALLRSALGRAVTVINDADAAGCAEMAFGAGRKRGGVVIVVTLGTGIGSALFIDGRLVPNTELGHLVIHGKAAETRASANARKKQALSWKAWARRLDEYLRYVEDLLSPELFILGGGVSKKHEKFFHHFTADTPVVPAEMRNDAGIVGAALAAR